jgi:tryptophanyl-tRNA synthetase
MAADILLYSPDVVPVGQDQKQHVEIARDTAEKFNRTFGETFKLPKEYIVENVKVVPGTDGQKMSKSYKNTIPLFATDDEIKKAVMGIPTDSKGIDEAKDTSTDKIFALHALFSSADELAALSDRYRKGGIGYKESKEILIANISKFIKPLRENRERIAMDQENILEILHEGGQRAKQVADAKMNEVREKVGIKLY